MGLPVVRRRYKVWTVTLQMLLVDLNKMYTSLKFYANRRPWRGSKLENNDTFAANLNLWDFTKYSLILNTSYGWIGMKFGTVIELKALNQMIP